MACFVDCGNRVACLQAPRGTLCGRYIVAGLSSNVSLQAMRADPQLREAFLVRDGRQWRPPCVNETCCRRPQLAALLRAGNHQLRHTR